MRYIFSIRRAFLGLLYHHFRKKKVINFIGSMIIAMTSAWFGGYLVLFFGIALEVIIFGGIIITIAAFILFFITQANVGENKKTKRQYQLYNEIIRDDLLFLKDKR